MLHTLAESNTPTITKEMINVIGSAMIKYPHLIYINVSGKVHRKKRIKHRKNYVFQQKDVPRFYLIEFFAQTKRVTSAIRPANASI
jgi:hypothetical protein